MRYIGWIVYGVDNDDYHESSKIFYTREDTQQYLKDIQESYPKTFYRIFRLIEE